MPRIKIRQYLFSPKQLEEFLNEIQKHGDTVISVQLMGLTNYVERDKAYHWLVLTESDE